MIQLPSKYVILGRVKNSLIGARRQDYPLLSNRPLEETLATTAKYFNMQWGLQTIESKDRDRMGRPAHRLDEKHHARAGKVDEQQLRSCL